MTTSVEESIPSPRTAKLPAKTPIDIFQTDKIKLPIALIQEVRISVFSFKQFWLILL